jgi:hypothetical protein
MLPMLRSRRNLLVTAFCWALLGAGLVVMLAQTTDLRGRDATLLLLVPLVVEMFVVSSSWYICVAEPLRITHMLRIIVIHALTAGLTALLWMLALSGQARLLDWLRHEPHWAPQLARVRITLLVIGVVLYMIASFIHYLVIAVQRVMAAEQEALTRRLALSDAELRALRATIHPHFLFNSLTSLSTLIIQEPSRARELCLRLSDFMRYSLRYQQDALVTLGDEINHAANYLNIEHLRWEDRLQVAWAVDEGQHHFPVPSLILFPLVENAVKHGIQQRLAGGTITIAVTAQGEGLRIEITNPLPDADAPKPVGEQLGLKTLRRRLENYYHGLATIWLGERAGLFCASLHIPRTEPAMLRSEP